MTFSLKKSFFLQFLLYFSLTLVVLGIFQASIGTIRLYNASEQEYEKLSPDSIDSPSLNTTSIPEKKTTPESPTKKVYYEVANEENSAQNPVSRVPKNTPLEQTHTTEINTENIKIVKKSTPKKQNTSPVDISVTPEKSTAPKGYTETIGKVITGTYFRDALWKFAIIIDTGRVEPRGQMYNESITLGTGMKTMQEVSKVLVHEIGHMIDIYELKKNLRRSDPSESFYTISWKNPTTIRAGVPQTAFISGYAATNQYEDFAESFVMYVFHNTEFQKRAQENDFLKQKYTFLKSWIFGDAYLGSSYEKDTIPKKIWDVTRISLRGSTIDPIFAWIDSGVIYKS